MTDKLFSLQVMADQEPLLSFGIQGIDIVIVFNITGIWLLSVNFNFTQYQKGIKEEEKYFIHTYHFIPQDILSIKYSPEKFKWLFNENRKIFFY